MASRRTNLIGMVVPDARQPFFAELSHAVERVASERGKIVLIGNSDYVGDREMHYVRAFLGMRVSGLILISQGPSQQAATEFAAQDDSRVVLLHRRPESAEDVAVVTDDVGGAQLAVEHLLGHGHAYVACFGGPVASPAPGDPVIDHIEGWRRAMSAAGLDTEGRLIDAPFDRYGARAVAVELLRSPDRPPAIFCSTDDQAIGVARAAREVGVRIPEDLALAGFDDIPEAAFCDPPLTTIASDRDAMAKAAVDLVLDDSLLVPGSDTPRVRRFPSRLVTRRSCGCG